MNNYRDKGTVWLMDHAHEVALDIADGNPTAAVAVLTLIETVKGARAFHDMMIDFSPEEWEKLYHICNEDPDLLSSNVIAINMICSNNNGKAIVRKNMGFTKPALFTENMIDDTHGLVGNNLFKFERQCFDEFMPRYSNAKRTQPRTR